MYNTLYVCIYIYIYIERERERYIYSYTENCGITQPCKALVVFRHKSGSEITPVRAQPQEFTTL